MKTAIYGGSFNPPHKGHVSVARAVLEELKPERFLIVPDRIPPHKELPVNAPTPEDRLEMCKMAFGSLPGVEISDLELLREGKSYTIDTLTRVHSLYPEDELILAVGSDNLLTFEAWRQFREILALCTIAGVSREKDEWEELENYASYLRTAYGAKVVILKKEPLVVSSTEIREKLKEGKPSDFIPESVMTYIHEHNLYRE